MRNDFFYKTTILFVTVFWTVCCLAQEKTTVSARIDRSRILIGEPISLTLEADIPEHDPIRFFYIDSIPHFEFLNVQPIDTTNTGTGTRLRQVIQITSFDSGHWVIPSFMLAESMSTDSIPVDVGYSDFDRNQPYHDVKEIIEVKAQEEEEKQTWWYYVVGAALLLVLLVLLLRKKKKPVAQVVVAPPDPYKTALQQLLQIENHKLEPKQFYTRLVDIFRVYVLEKKGIHSLQATTDDLVVQLQALGMKRDQFELLSAALRQSDLVKYAKQEPSADDDKNAWATIYRSIQQIEQIP